VGVSDTRGIGEAARASGLSVSALRFYDGAGVLVPAVVDPATGYRRYTIGQIKAARLIAGLRRVGMPVADIAQAVRDLQDQDPSSVRVKLDDHLSRLEAGFADARRELLRLHTLLDLEENLMTRLTLTTKALAGALDAVRFAAAGATDPIPAGVLFETGDGLLTLVATDRYRLAVASVPAAVEGPPARRFLPLDLADELRGLPAGPVTLDLTADRAHGQAGDTVVEGKPIDMDFPDYQRLLPAAGGPGRHVAVDTAALRAQVTAAPVVAKEHEGHPYSCLVLGLDQAGSLRVLTQGEWEADADALVAVNREFLLEAIDAGGPGQLRLELDGPLKPLAVRVPGDDTRFSLLMPVRP
jgi:DNA polymerase-3 subunit beta